MSAKELFHIGQRVKLTQDGLDHLGCMNNRNSHSPHDPTLRGTVRGFGRQSWIVRVQRDGIKSTDAYSMDFWEAA